MRPQDTVSNSGTQQAIWTHIHSMLVYVSINGFWNSTVYFNVEDTTSLKGLLLKEPPELNYAKMSVFKDCQNLLPRILSV